MLVTHAIISKVQNTFSPEDQANDVAEQINNLRIKYEMPTMKAFYVSESVAFVEIMQEVFSEAENEADLLSKFKPLE